MSARRRLFGSPEAQALLQAEQEPEPGGVDPTVEPGGASLRDIFAQARRQRAEEQERARQEAALAASVSPLPTLGSLLEETATPYAVSPTERLPRRVPGQELLVPLGPSIEVASEEAYRTYLIPILPDEPSPHLVDPQWGRYLFVQHDTLLSLRSNPRSRGLAFSLQIPVPESELQRWKRLGVHNLVFKERLPGPEGGLEPVTVLQHGLTLEFMRLGRSNSEREGTFYVFYELSVATREIRDGKRLVLTYKARLLTSDLRELAQGRLPGVGPSTELAIARPVQASIQFEAPREDLYPVLADLRRLP